MFSRSPGSHLRHLNEILTVLESSGTSLSIEKYHFAMTAYALLRHHMSWLSTSTAENKIAVVKAMIFLGNLPGLEAGCQFFNYYRKFVKHYSPIAELINILKARGFRNGPSKCRAFILSPRRRMESQKKERQSHGIIHWLLAHHQSENTNQLCALSGDWSVRCSSLYSEIWGLSLPCRVYTYWCMGT